ncbi:MAG: hypothetical protein ACYTGG_08070, partial [Planctomycetota bacterium]
MSGTDSSITLDASGSLWTRLRYTPLRDVVRGRVTGRLDVRGLVARSTLPDPLQAHVLDVVRRTRLWRLEKMDVAAELIAHFADGLEAGRSPETLAAAFGDAACAAVLIRRAKKRSRPAGWRCAMYASRAGGLLLVLLIVTYLFLAARLWLGRPNIAHDYLADINAPVRALAERERAWPIYREAMLALPAAPMISAEGPPRPGDPDWPAIASYLEDNASILAQVRAASSRPGLGYEYGYGTDEADEALFGPAASSFENMEAGLYGVLLPQLSKLRMLGGVLRDDALRAAADGDIDMALADITALLNLARQVHDGPFPIDQLVGIAIAKMAVRTSGDVLAAFADAFTDEQLRDLAHVLGRGGADAWQVDMTVERMGFEDVLQRVYTDDGAGDGRLTVSGLRLLHSFLDVDTGVLTDGPATSVLAMPLSAALIAGRKDMRQAFERLMDLAQRQQAQPLWERGIDPVVAEEERLSSDALTMARYSPMLAFVPNLVKPDVSAAMLDLSRDAVQTAIAVHLFRRRSGSWPDSIQSLVPAYL